MSNIQDLYNHLYIQVNNHIQSLCKRISDATDMQFMQLNIVELFTRLFVSALTTLATGYELIRYFTMFKFIGTIPVNYAE